MKRFLVDSSLFVKVLRRKSSFVGLYENIPGKITTSTICIAELYEGIYKSKDQESAFTRLTKLLSTVSIIFPFTEAEAKMFGEIKAVMKRTLIPDMDLQIAVTCLIHQLTLVTLDMKHFPRVPDLQILDISKNPS